VILALSILVQHIRDLKTKSLNISINLFNLQMRWRTLLILLVLLIFPAMAFAASEVTNEPIKNSITLTETATFKLSITNNAAVKQRYSIFSFVQGWDIEPYPLKDKIIEVFPGSTKTTTIKAKPKEAFKPGIYNLDLNVESDLGEKYSESLNVYVNPQTPMDYLPSIKAVVGVSNKMNPQEPQLIGLFMENRNPLNLEDLVIRLQSDLTEFNKETTIHLPPLEKKNIEFTINPNPIQKPGKYFLFFSFEKGGDVVKVIPQEIEIIPITPPFVVDITKKESFLKTITSIEIRNIGNIEDNQEVTLPVSFWESLFTYSSAKNAEKDGKRVLSWEVTLLSDESIVLTAAKNYRYPFYILILLIIIASVYFYLRTPVSLIKNATHSKKDATLSELKIRLHLKNLTKKTMKNIEVIDLIPGIADIEKGLELGTLRPHEVKHTKKGTLVKWKLSEIDPKEDRLISYKIKSKLKIIGTLKLPRAKAVFGSKGKRKAAYSNYFKISS
jgi:hypothetical protein